VSSCVFPSAGRNLVPRDAVLYNNVGFSPGSRPGERPEVKKGAAKIVPDYYYRTPPTASGARITRSRPKRFPPASRFYSNPYALKPPRNYPFYDSDHYYVPPKNSNNSENSAVGPVKPRVAKEKNDLY